MKNPRTILTLVLAPMLATTLAVVGVSAYAASRAQAQVTQRVTSASANLTVEILPTSANLSNIGFNARRHNNVRVANTGTLPLGEVRARFSDANGSALGTNATRGMVVRIDSCSVPWESSGACTGTARNLFNQSFASSTDLLVLPGLAVGAEANLKFQYNLAPQTETVTDGVHPTGSMAGISTSFVTTFSATTVKP